MNKILDQKESILFKQNRINKYFAYIYKKFPYKMYKIIEELYYTKDYDMLSSYRYYQKFAVPFNKLSLNEYIYNLNKHNINYNRGPRK